MLKKIYLFILLAANFLNVAGCKTMNNGESVPTSSQPNITLSQTPINSNTTSYWEGNSALVWEKLQETPLNKLRNLLSEPQNESNVGWLKLALIEKTEGNNTSQLAAALLNWRKQNPTHPGNALIPEDMALTNLVTNPYPKHIALLLPLKGPLSSLGQVVRDGFLSAYYESLAKNPGQTISFYNTNQTANISSLYQQALEKGADLIVGPLTKEQVQQLTGRNDYPIPTIALNYTEMQGSSASHNLFQFGLSPQDEVEQMALKAYKAGLTRAIIIAPQDTWGQRLAQPFIEQWQAKGGVMTDSYYYSPRAKFSEDIAHLMHVNPQQDRTQMQEDNAKQTLQSQRRQDFDVIFLLTPPEDGREIVPLLKYYYTDNIPIYSTSVIFTGHASPQKDYDLNGVIFCDIPWILQKAGKNNASRLYAVGRDALLIGNNLNRLLILPYFPLPAATGTLSLNNRNQIYRKVQWTKMHAGHP